MKTLALALLLTAVSAAAVVAQTQTPRPPQNPQQKPADPEQTIKVTSTVVNTLFTVADKRNKLITNLKKEDFKIFEDDKEQVVTGFSSETDLPLSIALLVDTSGSIRDKLLLEQEYAIQFFYAALHKNKDRAMVVSFDSGVDMLQDFTDDSESLSKAIRKIRAGGGTSLYDAVYLAISEKLSKEAEDRRKVLVLISDGDDNSSRLSMTETLDLAQKFNITIYSISTNSSAYFGSKEQDRGDKTLKKFSEDTGGKAFFPLNIKDMGANFTEIADELRSQYTIGYRPTKPDDGTFRRIRIEVSNKNYKARHRTGYFSPKPATSPN